MSFLLAITRDDVANYVSAVFLVYFILIFIRILLSWIPRMPYYPWLRATVDFIHQVVDPYLNIFRRVIPPLGAGGMGIDISPILAIIVLAIVSRVVVALIAGGGAELSHCWFRGSPPAVRSSRSIRGQRRSRA